MKALLLHNVVEEPLDVFDRQLERLHGNAFRRLLEELRQRYRIVGLDEALALLDAGEPVDDMLLVTFDDGFSGVYSVARPILAELGLVATVFVLTLPGGGMSADRRFHFEQLEIAFRLTAASAIDLAWCGLGVVPLRTPAERCHALRTVKRHLKLLPHVAARTRQARVLEVLGVEGAAIEAYAATSPRYRKLGLDECRALGAEGWTIGGHTRTHPSLAQVDDGALADEIEGNARDLRALGFDAAPFAYPYGGDDHVDARARSRVRAAGFRCAFTTVPGEIEAGTDRFRLPRYSLPALRQWELERSIVRRPAVAAPPRVAATPRLVSER